MTPEQIAELEGRLLAVEKELVALRGMLAAATRCICPVGFGSQPDPRCPRHGAR